MEKFYTNTSVTIDKVIYDKYWANQISSSEEEDEDALSDVECHPFTESKREIHPLPDDDR